MNCAFDNAILAKARLPNSKISNNSKPSPEEHAKAQYQVRLRGVALQLYKLRRAAVKERMIGALSQHGHFLYAKATPLGP
jgi:hypothetical protein